MEPITKPTTVEAYIKDRGGKRVNDQAKTAFVAQLDAVADRVARAALAAMAAAGEKTLLPEHVAAGFRTLSGDGPANPQTVFAATVEFFRGTEPYLGARPLPSDFNTDPSVSGWIRDIERTWEDQVTGKFACELRPTKAQRRLVFRLSVSWGSPKPNYFVRQPGVNYFRILGPSPMSDRAVKGGQDALLFTGPGAAPGVGTEVPHELGHLFDLPVNTHHDPRADALMNQFPFQSRIYPDYLEHRRLRRNFSPLPGRHPVPLMRGGHRRTNLHPEDLPLQTGVAPVLGPQCVAAALGHPLERCQDAPLPQRLGAR